MINILIAIHCEAKPLLKHFGLKGSTDHGPFRVYESKELRLIISGIGKVSAAAAASYVFARYDRSPSSAWLNIGTAGHAAYPIGKGILAHKITDAGNGLSWYPPLILKAPGQTETVITVDRPELEYTGTAVYEMEAAGFYATASRFCTSELIHCYKVISDNRSRPASLITKDFAASLIAENIPEIDALIQQLNGLATKLSAIVEEPPPLKKMLANWRFTTYEQYRLRHLVRRWCLLSDGNINSDQSFTHCKTGKEVLSYLQSVVDEISLHSVEPQ